LQLLLLLSCTSEMKSVQWFGSLIQIYLYHSALVTRHSSVIKLHVSSSFFILTKSTAHLGAHPQLATAVLVFVYYLALAKPQGEPKVQYYNKKQGDPQQTNPKQKTKATLKLIYMLHLLLAERASEWASEQLEFESSSECLRRVELSEWAHGEKGAKLTTRSGDASLMSRKCNSCALPESRLRSNGEFSASDY